MSDEMGVRVSKDGPYEVQGEVPLVRAEIVTNEKGESVSWRELKRYPSHTGGYQLCRCGKSQTKPFCDGSHIIEGFDGTETAAHDHYFQEAATIPGPVAELRDHRPLCAEARFCNRAGGLWNLIGHADDADTQQLVEEEAANCPSGRYVVCDPDGTPHEPELEPSIAVIEDPKMRVSGGLWVRGGIPVASAEDGPYEVRNRVTLCRCGQSRNKPFCDGSHIGAKFSDEE